MRNLLFLLILVSSFQSAYAVCPNLNASFTVSQTSFCGTGPHLVNFTNTTTPGSLSGVSFAWYADGILFSTSTLVSQTVSFYLSGIGAHVFSLVVTDPSIPCTETATVPVTVYPQPVSSFTFPSTGFCTNNTIPFTNTSTGTNASSSYLWNFGGGATSATANPTYGFPTAGAQTISLTITNGPTCTSTSVQTTSINLGPQINISGDDGDGDLTYCLFPADVTTSETVAFSNSTTNAISYVWDFGDGSPFFNTASTATFNHIYSSYGTYTATMTATSANGCQDTDTLIVVFEKYVSSGLTLNITEYSGCIPHSITTLTNLSVNANTYTWNFGDGTTVTTTSPTPPTHNYVLGGTYTITLTASNSCNTSNATISPIIVISSPVVNFTPSLTVGCAPQTISFTNNSTNAQPPNNYQWNMGNGNSYTNVVTPVPQLYSNAGTYTVQLIAGNGCGYDTVIHTILLDTIPTVELTLTPLNGCTPLTVDPTATLLSGNAVNWTWSVDGSTISSAPNDIANQTFTTVNLIDSSVHTIQVNVSNTCGSDSDIETAIVHPSVLAEFTSIDTVCIGSSITFSNVSVGTQLSYSWNFGDGSPLDVSTNPTYSYSTAGNYNVTLTTTGFCGTSTFVKTITVVAIPTISIAASTSTICNGESVLFTNSSSTSGDYFWNFGANASISTSTLYSPPAVSFFGSALTNTIYFSINDGGCSAIDSLTITLSESPVASFTFTPNSGCSPVTVNLTNTTSLVPGDIYLWNYGNGTTGSAYSPTNPTYSSILVDTQYQISLWVENSVGCKDSVQHLISVFSLPIASFSIPNDTICQGQSTSFTNNSTNAATYHWDFGNGIISNAASPIYTYPNPGFYTVQLIAFTTQNCSDTSYQSIHIDSIPNTNFSANSVCLGNTTEFTLSQPSYQTTYTWDFGDGSAIFTGIDPSYIYSNAGNYTATVSATNAYACSNTSSISVSVQSIPEPLFSWAQTCLGDATNFANATPGIFNAHVWDFGDGNSASSFNASHTYADTGSFLVKLISTNLIGCSDSTFLTVYIDSIPTVDFNYTSTCSGDTTFFSNLSFYPPCDYSWDFGDGNNSIQENPFNVYVAANFYTVTLTATYPSNGCSIQNTQVVESFPHTAPNFSTANHCLEDATSFTDLSINSPISWEWNFGDGATNTNQSPTHTYTSFGTYTVSLVTTNSYGCSDTISQSIEIHALPTANFTVTTECEGASTEFTNVSLDQVLSEWNFVDGSPIESVFEPNHIYSNDGTFLTELIVTSAFGCLDTLIQNVTVHPNPVANFTPDSICLGLSNSFSDFSTSAVSWLYDFGDGNFGSLQNESHTYSNPGTYTVEQLVTNIFGCQDSILSTVVVYDLPEAIFSNPTLCEDEASNFQDQSTGNLVSWLWDFDDSGATSIVQNPSHSYTNSGFYNVQLTVTDINSCVDDTSIVLNAVAKPVVNFSFDTVCFNSPTHFTDLTQDPLGIASWQYSFGEFSNQSTAQNPNYIYQNPGSFTVLLTATNSFGCTDTVSHSVLVEEVPVANFSFDTVCFGNSTTFTNLSTVPSTSFQWSFGDGSTLEDTIQTEHNYSLAGQYAVSLTAFSPFYCSHTYTQIVPILESPVSDFIGSQTCFGDSTLFSNQSLGTITDQIWNFGDGSATNDLEPNHLYQDTGAFTVQLITTNTLGCTDSISIQIYIDSIPTVDFTFTSVCSNDETEFVNTSFSAPANYAWDFGDGASSTLFSPSHIYTVAGTYSVELEVSYASNGCSVIQSHSVDAFPHTVPNFSASNFCHQDQTNFTDLSTNSVQSWQWNFGDGSAFSNVASPNHTYTSPGLYSVQLITSNLFGCADTLLEQIEIFALPLPIFSTSVECLGAPTLFTNTSSNFTSVAWDFGDGSPISSTTMPNHTYLNDGTYPVGLILISNQGCTDTLVQNAIVHPNPAANFTVDSVCFGLSNTFTDLSTGGFSWLYDFGDGNSASSSSAAHYYSVPGTYVTKQIVTNAFGCQDSLSLTLAVYQLPVANFSAPTMCEDETTLFTDLSIGTVNLWSWDFDDAGSTSSLQNPTHIYTNGGNYSVNLLVQDNHNCTDDTTILVNSVAKPTVDFLFDTVCYLTPTHFSDISTDPLGITNWLYDFGDFNQSSAENPIHIYPTSGSFTVLLTASNSFGCSDTISHLIEVKDVPVPEFTFDTVCFGNSTTFTDLSTGVISSWDWDFGDGTTTTASGNTSHIFPSAGNFIVTLHLNSASQCGESIAHSVFVYNGITPEIGAPTHACENGTVQFYDITPPSSTVTTAWLWDFGDGTTSNAANPTHSYSTFGNYYVTLTLTTSSGCSGTSGFNLMIDPPPTIQIISDTVCEGQATNLYALSNMIVGSWTWNFGDASAISNAQSPVHVYPNSGNYTVTLDIIADNGCSANTSEIVTVFSSPTADFTYIPACPGEPVLFTNTSTGSISNYEWIFNNSIINTNTNTDFTFPSNIAQPTFTLVAISSLGCTDTSTQIIQNHSVVDFNFGPIQASGCEDFLSTFYDSSLVSNSTIINWMWDFGDGYNAISSNPNHVYTDPGTYSISLSVTTADNCVYTDVLAFPIVVYPAPIAGFIYPFEEYNMNHSVVPFSDLSQGALNWAWDFGDFTYSNEANPVHTFTDTGRFYITQIVYNQYGCSDTAISDVHINSSTLVYVPNAFTPDGNEYNNYFNIKGEGIKAFTLTIYNRWGEKLFATSDFDAGWQGDFKGQPCQEDVYVWKLNYYDFQNESHVMTGHVTLLRE